MAATVEQMVKDFGTLTDEDQQHFRALLDGGGAKTSAATPQQHRRLAERLLADGLLEHVPPDAQTEAARDRHEPVKVLGRPVSETLLEDRE